MWLHVGRVKFGGCQKATQERSLDLCSMVVNADYYSHVTVMAVSTQLIPEGYQLVAASLSARPSTRELTTLNLHAYFDREILHRRVYAQKPVGTPLTSAV